MTEERATWDKALDERLAREEAASREALLAAEPSEPDGVPIEGIEPDGVGTAEREALIGPTRDEEREAFGLVAEARTRDSAAGLYLTAAAMFLCAAVVFIWMGTRPPEPAEAPFGAQAPYGAEAPPGAEAPAYPRLALPAPLATALPVPERTASEPGGAAGPRKPIELEFGPEPSIDDFQGPEPEI